MAVKTIITEPNKLLRQISKPVESVGKEEQQLMDDMLDTMYDAPGIGLAAPQVGVTKRLIVIDVTESDDSRHTYKMINPKITWFSNELSNYEEGCLSLPKQYANVIRPEQICVEFLDYEGKLKTIDAKGVLATCIQHEIDHLDGTLFVDHITKLRRDLIIRKLKKYKSEKKT